MTRKHDENDGWIGRSAPDPIAQIRRDRERRAAAHEASKARELAEIGERPSDRFSLSRFEEWREAQAKLVELQEQHTAADRRRAELEGLIATADRNAELDAAADALLEGGDVSTLDLQQLRHERDDLRAQVKVIDRAIARHRGRMDALRGALSKRIADEARPEYEAIVAGVAAALEDLVALRKREVALHRELDAGGATWNSYLPAHAFTDAAFRNPFDLERGNGILGHWFARARELGYLPSPDSKAA